MTQKDALNELLTMLARYSFDADEAQAIGKAMEALRPVSLEKADDDDPASQRLVNMAKNVVRSHTLERIEEAWRGEWEWYDEEIGSPLEGVEREWGWRCSKCKIVLPDDFDDPDNPPAMRFCQWCGAPMTDEAVEVAMKRLEVLNEKD
nr:MAG TPA: Rubredoxin loop, ELECTRON TRANSPORT [Caudoviricetes sp.]